MWRRMILVLLLASLLGLVWVDVAQAQVYVRFPGANSGWGGPYEYVHYGRNVRYYSPWYPTVSYRVWYPSDYGYVASPWYNMNYGANYGPAYYYSYPIYRW